jgi:hypothetical protein
VWWVVNGNLSRRINISIELHIMAIFGSSAALDKMEKRRQRSAEKRGVQEKDE